MPAQRIAILGGTFDPIHFGHLRLAVELREALTSEATICRVHLIPCHIPVHRPSPQASAEQRTHMLRLALDGRAGFSLDLREMASAQPSFTINTLESLRAEYPSAQLIICCGSDALASFCQWHRWRDALKLASLLIATRPHNVAPCIPDELAEYPQVPPATLSGAGKIARLEVSQIDISSSDIRRRLARAQAVDFLLPDQVAHYIAQHKLYLKHEVIGIDHSIRN